MNGNVFRGLAFRILIFLTLALLPFGIIAVFQTQEISRNAQRSAELSLLALTEQSASAEKAAIQEAFGSASVLSSIIQTYLDDPAACSNFLATYREQSEIYSHIGFIPVDGVMECSSSGREVDFSGNEQFQKILGNGARTITMNTRGPVSGLPVLVLSHPLKDDGGLLGFVNMSFPISDLDNMPRPDVERRPFDLVTFNASGDVLLSRRAAEDSAKELPRNRSIKALVGTEPTVFRDESASGEQRVYAVVPILNGSVYSISLWREADLLASVDGVDRLSIFMPVLMWLASLVVAFWSLNRLAVRHIRKLARQMRHFAYNRSMPRSTLSGGVPRELSEMQLAFTGMAESIIRDEAALEDSIRDKNILLKEVHHRVKNNLQLISSMMNMQIRRAQSEDARVVLKRLQERILSLATVHKNLYQNDALDRVDAGALVEEIVGQLLVVGLPAGTGVKVEQHFDPVEMDADDAAPLTLLVSETVTNAMKYIGPSTKGAPVRLAITLRKIDADTVKFSIVNSASPDGGTDGTGLGTQLINAFARQLNAQVEVGYENGMHRLHVFFPVTYRDRYQQDF